MAQLLNQWISKLPNENAAIAAPSAIGENEDAKKTAFAIELLKSPADPFRAALTVFSTNTNKALRVANEWPGDAFVIAEVKRIKEEEGELSFLPSKADLARSLWERAHRQERPPCDDDFTKMAKLYAEIMGYVVKEPKVEINNKNTAGVQVIASPLDESL